MNLIKYQVVDACTHTNLTRLYMSESQPRCSLKGYSALLSSRIKHFEEVAIHWQDFVKSCGIMRLLIFNDVQLQTIGLQKKINIQDVPSIMNTFI